jgi:homoserine kinase
MKFVVKSPATTANLGPGFDCLGLALQVWNELEVSTTGDSLQIEIEGECQNILPKNERNPIYQAMQAAAKQLGKVLPQGVDLISRNRIPLGSGMGSSSAAIVSGIFAAYHLLGAPLDKDAIFNLAASIEGHPDNVAPCIFGGLTASMTDGSKFITRSLPITPLSLLVVTPDFAFPTSKSRAALPQEIPHKDAVYNLGHALLLIEAFKNGDLDLLSVAMKDKLHQPYRLPLIPGAKEALEAAQNAGAVASVISGAGSSLLAILRSKNDVEVVGNGMQSAFSKCGISSRVFAPLIDFEGTTLLEF